MTVAKRTVYHPSLFPCHWDFGLTGMGHASTHCFGRSQNWPLSPSVGNVPEAETRRKKVVSPSAEAEQLARFIPICTVITLPLSCCMR